MSLFEERMQLRNDSIAGKIPKRLFIAASFTVEAACGYAGIDLRKAHYDMELVEKAFDAICKDFYSDSLPVLNLRYPLPYQILGAKNWILGSNGVVQHPEIATMQPEEYDEFIDKPYETIVEKFLPRVCTELDTDAETKSLVLAKAYLAYTKTAGDTFGLYMKLSQKYGFAPGFITGELLAAPFDFIADQCRGFKEITMDLRRRPDKVKAACDAVLPLMLRRATGAGTPPGKVNFIPLHLAPFIRTSDFEKYYWPTLEQLVVEQHKVGLASYLFVEQDWSRFAEYLERLPETSIFLIEDGDPALFKKTAGKNHLMGGFFDPTITLTRTKEECIDEVKRLVDTCAPGGRFYFGFDKGIMDIKSVDVTKLQAVLEWVHVNTDY